MKEITLKIPDTQFDFFMELVRQLGLEIAGEDEMEIPEAHKAIVRERIKQSDENPGRLLDWEQVKDHFTFD